MTQTWKIIIGLEIHAELNTRSKLFSKAPNRFGDEPNTNISEVCTGQPGALPVLNKEAVHKAVQFGCAINADVAHFSKFDRKSYFYPDSPRNFQITQFDQPIVLGGRVVTEIDGEEKTFEVDRAHLEDDAGMLKHFSSFAGVDYNRAGVPLIEIVSMPCIHSGKEAAAYAMAIKAILQYLDVSDCNMEEGSLRFDANISVMHETDTEFRNKIEIKNMNSFNFLEMAIESETKRQIKLYEKNPDKDPAELVKQATYRWDPEKKETVLMRRKEAADDYRYFPEPDLVPIVLQQSYIDQVKATLPELPLERERRYLREYALSRDLAFSLVSDKKRADYFEKALEICNHPKTIANWIMVEFAGRLKEKNQELYDTKITPENLGHLVLMIHDKVITGRIAKQVADDMIKQPEKSCREIVKENPDYQPMHDTSAIEPLVQEVIDQNPQSIEDFKAGKDKAFSFLVGQVMKKTRGKASPQVVNELIRKKIGMS